mgnify:CR=1 FL=1
MVETSDIILGAGVLGAGYVAVSGSGSGISGRVLSDVTRNIASATNGGGNGGNSAQLAAVLGSIQNQNQGGTGEIVDTISQGFENIQGTVTNQTNGNGGGNNDELLGQFLEYVNNTKDTVQDTVDTTTNTVTETVDNTGTTSTNENTSNPGGPTGYGPGDLRRFVSNPEPGAQPGDYLNAGYTAVTGAEDIVGGTLGTLTKTGNTLAETTKALAGERYNTENTFANSGNADVRRLYQGSLVNQGQSAAASYLDESAGKTDEAVGRATEAAKNGDWVSVGDNLTGGIFG